MRFGTERNPKHHRGKLGQSVGLPPGEDQQSVPDLAGLTDMVLDFHSNPHLISSVDMAINSIARGHSFEPNYVHNNVSVCYYL